MNCKFSTIDLGHTKDIGSVCQLTTLTIVLPVLSRGLCPPASHYLMGLLDQYGNKPKDPIVIDVTTILVILIPFIVLTLLRQEESVT